MRPVSIDEVQRETAAFYRVSVEEMLGRDRHIEFNEPRQVAMYLCRQAGISFPKIGRAFGNRDHSTVMSAVKRIEGRREQEQDLDDSIRSIRRRLSVRKEERPPMAMTRLEELEALYGEASA